jgi:hypothetical protein
VTDAALVTLYDEEIVRLRSGTVRVVPAWRWLLEGGEGGQLPLG